MDKELHRYVPGSIQSHFGAALGKWETWQDFVTDARKRRKRRRFRWGFHRDQRKDGRLPRRSLDSEQAVIRAW